MRAFFNGWRRKAGCGLLVMACVLGLAWARSYFVEDHFICRSHALAYFVSSAGGALEVEANSARHAVRDSLGLWPTGWTRKPGILLISPDEGTVEEIAEEIARFQPIEQIDRFKNLTPDYRWRWCGFDFGAAENELWQARVWFWAIPYWSLAIPLTILSSYLILCKPRKKSGKSSFSLPQAPIPNP